MNWLRSIVDLISGLLKAVPEILRLFKKPTEAKVEDAIKPIDDKEKKFEETGRPQ